MKGRHTRSIVLDDEAGDEADRLNNLSEWVRIQLHAKARGDEKVLIEDLPTSRVAAILLARIDRMVREAGMDEEMMPVPELLEVAQAVRQWFTSGF